MMWLILYFLGTLGFWAFTEKYCKQWDTDDRVIGTVMWPVLMFFTILCAPYWAITAIMEKKDVGIDSDTSV